MYIPILSVSPIAFRFINEVPNHAYMFLFFQVRPKTEFSISASFPIRRFYEGLSFSWHLFIRKIMTIIS